MGVKLDRVLQVTRAGQWSLEDIDWHRPLEGARGLSSRELRDAGLALVFTAGLERQASRIFHLAAQFVTDERAKDIYALFEQDELRHAEAELRLAQRLGASWQDLPRVTRLMFKRLSRNFDRPSPLIYEFTTTQILLFEIALDALLIPTLKESIDDPLHKEVFKRIDQDESRHLAMDYWLLERKAHGKDTYEIRHQGRELVRRLPNILLLPIGFAAFAREARLIQRRIMASERLEHYWTRVNGIPRRAPNALDLPAFKRAIRVQRRLQRSMMIATGRRHEKLPDFSPVAASAAEAATDETAPLVA